MPRAGDMGLPPPDQSIPVQNLTRRSLVASAAAMAATPALAQAQVDPALGFTPDPAFVAQAEKLLRDNLAIDLHAHPGLTFARDAANLSAAAQAIVASGPFETKAIADMKAGGMAGGSFAAVADLQILDAVGAGMGSGREFQPGEAWSSYQRQIANLQKVVPASGAMLVKQPSDFAGAKRAGKIGAMLMVEGGDFLEGDLAHLKTAFNDGVRAITLVHYHQNELGDIQTAPARAGLTAFGRETVREMNRLGMVVDIAHAAEATGLAMVKASGRPVMCSHTVIGADYPRFISEAYAREIAAAGGVIGVWPSGFGATKLSEFVDRIFKVRDVAGAKAVALGTDMDANFKPVMTSYRQLPLVVSELLKRGYGAQDTAAFLGGNFLRVFQATWAGRAA